VLSNLACRLPRRKPSSPTSSGPGAKDRSIRNPSEPARASSARSRSGLDHVAQLNARVVGQREGWDVAQDPYSVVVYPSAGEAVITRRGRSDSRPAAFGGNRVPSAPRRARAKLRRLIVTYELGLFVTLTFGRPVGDYDQVKAEFRAFLRRLRLMHDGQVLWVAVIEAHASGALHIHAALCAVPRKHLRRAWSLGHIDIRFLRSTDDRREVAKYMAKTFDGPRPRGRHRFEHAQGMHVLAVQCTAPDEASAWGLAIERMGTPPTSVSDSREWREWNGPTITVLWWWGDVPPHPERVNGQKCSVPHRVGVGHLKVATSTN